MVYLWGFGTLSYLDSNIGVDLISRPKGNGYTAFARGIKGEFADPENSDLYFKYKFGLFQEEWK